MKIKYEFITRYRVLAVIFILMCHFVNESANQYINMTAQFFNIGVEMFFLISGFCFGLQGEITEMKKWYKKRFKRIYIPYELFLVLLAVVYITMGLTFNVTNWLTCLLGVQGAVVGVLGADHTWFISVILLCYLITPIISRLWSKLANESNFKKHY